MSDRSPESADEEPTHDDRPENEPTQDDQPESEPTGTAQRATEGQQITIPPETVAAIEDRLTATEFESVEAYSVFALESLLRQLETLDEEPAPDTVGEHAGESEQPEGIEERLESLGYL